MGDKRHQLGKHGEELASIYLQDHGYKILALRFRTPDGEVDLVALREGCLVFVEVKARSSMEFEDPIEAVTVDKVRRISRVAYRYLSQYNWAGDWRIDVIGLTFSSYGELLRLEHLQDICL